jgi:hypothetical protein
LVKPEKKSLWIITVMKEVDQKVSFNEDIDADEALKRYINDDYEDIIDETESGFNEVVSVH